MFYQRLSWLSTYVTINRYLLSQKMLTARRRPFSRFFKLRITDHNNKTRHVQVPLAQRGLIDRNSTFLFLINNHRSCLVYFTITKKTENPDATILQNLWPFSMPNLMFLDQHEVPYRISFPCEYVNMRLKWRMWDHNLGVWFLQGTDLNI